MPYLRDELKLAEDFDAAKAEKEFKKYKNAPFA